ncbi:MAG: hypothetical protein ABSB35_13060 [Bryobacteraceae bacterium]
MTKKGRGQPKYQPTEADRTTVMVMTAAGLKQEDIAACIGTRGIDAKTLRKHFAHELSVGVAKVNALCSQGIVRAMQAGEAWALCFWAKARMGWQEKSTVGHQTLDEYGKPTRPGITIIVTDVATKNPPQVGAPVIEHRPPSGDLKKPRE